MIEDYQWFPWSVGAPLRTKEFAIDRAREYVSRDTTRPIGIYKLVAIVRGNVELTIEVVDGDE